MIIGSAFIILGSIWFSIVGIDYIIEGKTGRQYLKNTYKKGFLLSAILFFIGLICFWLLRNKI